MRREAKVKVWWRWPEKEMGGGVELRRWAARRLFYWLWVVKRKEEDGGRRWRKKMEGDGDGERGRVPRAAGGKGEGEILERLGWKGRGEGG